MFASYTRMMSWGNKFRKSIYMLDNQWLVFDCCCVSFWIRISIIPTCIGDCNSLIEVWLWQLCLYLPSPDPSLPSLGFKFLWSVDKMIQPLPDCQTKAWVFFFQYIYTIHLFFNVVFLVFHGKGWSFIKSSVRVARDFWQFAWFEGLYLVLLILVLLPLFCHILALFFPVWELVLYVKVSS